MFHIGVPSGGPGDRKLRAAQTRRERHQCGAHLTKQMGRQRVEGLARQRPGIAERRCPANNHGAWIWRRHGLTSEGGSLLEYEEEDRVVRARFRDALLENGVENKMTDELYEEGYALRRRIQEK